MKALLLDLDGVLYEGERLIPGAADAVSWLAEQEIPHLFLTNTTSRPRRLLVEKLDGLGINTRAERILTPAVAADSWLARHHPGPVALFVPDGTREDFQSQAAFEEDSPAPPASVVLGDLGTRWTFELLNRAFRHLIAEPAPALVALGMTRYWRAEDGLRLDAGPFVKALEYASGREPVVLGKPAGAFFETALDLLGVTAAEAVMVGDDIVGDVQGAQGAGIQALLVKTGKFRDGDLAGDIRPDDVLDSVAGLPVWWQRHGSRETPAPTDSG